MEQSKVQHTPASDHAPKLFTIPQLEWYDADDGRMRGHVNGRPLYRITARPESGVRWWRYEDGVDECRRVDTVETAKALCQLDFESQTASLLSPAGDALSRLAAAEQRVKDREGQINYLLTACERNGIEIPHPIPTPAESAATQDQADTEGEGQK